MAAIEWSEPGQDKKEIAAQHERESVSPVNVNINTVKVAALHVENYRLHAKKFNLSQFVRQAIDAEMERLGIAEPTKEGGK